MGRRAKTRRGKSGHASVRETIRDFLGALTVFAVVFAFAAVNSRAAHPQDAATASGPAVAVSQSDERTASHRGRLVIRSAEQTGDAASGAQTIAPLGSAWDIKITGPIVRTAITEVFHNRLDEPVDGIYVRPLPDNTTVDRLNLDFGGRTIVGSVAPLADADNGAEAAMLRQDLEAAMLRQDLSALMGPGNRNLFTGSVKDVAPGDRVSIQLEYQQSLEWRNGGYSLSIPLPPRNDAQDDSIQVSLEPGFPLGALHSESHHIAVKHVGDDRAVVTVQERKDEGRDGFDLSWKPAPATSPTARFISQAHGGGEYLVAMITPPAEQSALKPRPRDLVFVVDTSGSMAGSSIHQVRRSLERSIARLRPEDRFNIISFEATYEALFAEPVAADADNKAIARHFLERLAASGGTELVRPLSEALRDPTPDDTRRVRQIVLITDGAIRNGRQFLSEIAVKRGRSRLFLVGLGAAPSDRLLHHAAKVGRGAHVHIPSVNGLGVELDRFLTELERPVLTDLEIAWPKGTRAVSSLDPLPDLYGHAPLIASIRLDKRREGPIAISGTFDGKPWTVDAKPVAVDENAGAARLWAQQRIEALESHAQFTNAVTSDISAKIKKVALDHGLVGHMTRLAAVDTAPADGQAEAASRRGQPRANPAASAARTDDQKASLTTAAGSAKVSEAVEKAPVIVQSAEALPVTADTVAAEDAAPRSWSAFPGRLAAVGLMGLIFAAMSALTLGLWRHLGRSYARPRRRVAKDIEAA